MDTPLKWQRLCKFRNKLRDFHSLWICRFVLFSSQNNRELQISLLLTASSRIKTLTSVSVSTWCLPPDSLQKPLSLRRRSKSFPFSRFLHSSPHGDASLSVFSKSPLVAGSGPPPLPQTAIKTQSMAAQWAAWKWEDTRRERETEGHAGRRGWENCRGKDKKHLDTGQQPYRGGAWKKKKQKYQKGWKQARVRTEWRLTKDDQKQGEEEVGNRKWNGIKKQGRRSRIEWFESLRLELQHVRPFFLVSCLVWHL